MVLSAKKLYFISFKELIIFFIFFLSPVFDAITGFLVLNKIMSEGGLSSPSQIGKIITVLLTFFYLLKRNQLESVYKVFVLVLYVLLVESINCIFYNTPIYGYIYGFVQLYKVVYLILIYYFLKYLLNERYLSKEELIEYIIKSALIYSCILLLSTLLGINTSTYSSGTFASKGIFASGNALSIYLGFSSYLAGYYAYKIQRKRKNFVYFLIIWISCTIVGTKASIVFLGINFLLVFRYTTNVKRLLITLIFLILIKYLYSYFGRVFDVIIYRYKQSGNFSAFLASGRDKYLRDALLKYNTDGLNAFRIFFGSGAFVSFRSNLSDMKVFDTLERDLYDIFFMYGINMLILYFMFFIKNTYYGLVKKKYFFVIGFLCVFGYSLLAGHTVFNTMSGLGLVFFAILLRDFDDKKNNKKEVLA